MILICFFFLSLSACYVKNNDLNISNIQNNQTIYNSQSGKYLAANYSISKGDFFNANKILKSKSNDPTLLKLKFFSNLVTGNFKIANKISKKDYLKKKDQLLYGLPNLAINLKKNNFKISQKILDNNQTFLEFDKISLLLKYWVKLSDLANNNNFNVYDQNISQIPIHKLLILENFYNIKELKKIADYNNGLKSLSDIDLLLLAGFYFRYNDFQTFEKIIKYRLSDTLDKNYIFKNFSSSNNLFNKKLNMKTILSSYLYNIASEANDNNEKSSSYIKILLEMSLYISPNMDISRYLLADLYSNEGYKKLAYNMLNQIDENSFFFLPASVRILSIIKNFKQDKLYQSHLFKLYVKFPHNKFILYELANFYKSQNNYNDALNIYKKIIKIGDNNSHLIFLYAICLDKLGQWKEAQKVLLEIVKKNKPDAYVLNYLAYSMVIKKENLDFASVLINKALKLDINNGFFLDTFGWIEFQKKNYETALFYLQKAVILESSSSEIIDHLADCYLKLGRRNEAIYEWKKALKYENTKEALTLIRNKIKKYE